MENPTYASRMRYLDANDVDDAVVNFDGLKVHGPDGQKIGDVDGFIIDADAQRVNYVVVDSGGWFTSRRLLLPIGHASLTEDRGALQTDVTRDALKRLPEFDPNRFREFTDEELRAFERNTVVACCPDEPLEDVSVTSWGYDSRRHYQQPAWWENDRYSPERLQSVDDSARVRTEGARTTASAGTRDLHTRDVVTAREGRRDAPSRAAGDVSPHLDGRAQPGDVLGIETGGERTEVGATGEDEDERRRDAQRAAQKRREG